MIVFKGLVMFFQKSQKLFLFLRFKNSYHFQERITS